MGWDKILTKYQHDSAVNNYTAFFNGIFLSYTEISMIVLQCI